MVATNFLERLEVQFLKSFRSELFIHPISFQFESF